MDSKELVERLDKNQFYDKVFNIIDLVFAFWLILMPMLDFVFCCFGFDEFDIIFQLEVIPFFYLIFKSISLIINFKKINLKNKTIIDWLVLVLLVWFMVSTFVNNAINTNCLVGLSYFIVFVLVRSIDKKYYKLFANILIIELVFDTILGFIDLNNEFIPSFENGEYVMSFQFMNPNWSAFSVIIAEMLSLWLLLKSDKLWLKILYFIGFLIMTAGLFVGGSYAPEFFLIFAQLALLVFLWIKYKKCPWWILSAFLSTIFISFAVWFVPAWGKASTAAANFFYESLAVIDGKLGTNLVYNVSSFINKIFGGGTIDVVAGSDGWARNDLKAETYKAIFASPKSFFIGYGCRYIYEIRVHSMSLVIWLEFGFVGFLLYVAIIAMLLVKFIKVKKDDYLVFLLIVFLMLLFEGLFCSIEPFNFVYLIMITIVFHKTLCVSEGSFKKDKGKIYGKNED